MIDFGFASKTKLLFIIIAMILFLVMTAKVFASVPDLVTTYQDEQGWKLKVNGVIISSKG